MIYMLILPLIAGAISVAEEKGWGMAEWHLTLPPSALKQWSAKMLAALSTSLVLGLLLPAALFLAGAGTAGPARRREPPSVRLRLLRSCGWVLGQLLVTSVAVYAASFSKNTLRAILAAFVILVAGGGALWLAATWVHQVDPPPGAMDRPSPRGRRADIACFYPVALVFMLCLIQWFAWSNFRRYGCLLAGYSSSSP